jgi:hypothetical protein
MTYYSDIKFFNGLSVSSLFCYTALLCLHQCLLHTPCAFYSFAFYALCAMSLQCTIPLLYISVAALCLLLHTSITLNSNNTHLFSVLHTYSLCAPCACCPAMLLHSLSCRVLYLFIMETLQLLWQLDPSVNCLYKQCSFHW